jgi:hypothetical protein
LRICGALNPIAAPATPAPHAGNPLAARCGTVRILEKTGNHANLQR